jgi:hypothetical protein
MQTSPPESAADQSCARPSCLSVKKRAYCSQDWARDFTNAFAPAIPTQARGALLAADNDEFDQLSDKLRDEYDSGLDDVPTAAMERADPDRYADE